jgi:hypothetical protein
MLYERFVTTAGNAPAVRGPSITIPATRRPPNQGQPRARRPGRLASDRASTVRLQVFDLLVPWVVAAATLVARLATAATGPSDWDSSQYAAAVSRFDVTHGRPQPPGYWLYVTAGRLVHGTGLGTIESLVLVSALASAAGAGLVVVAGRDLGGRWVGMAAGLVVATSPFAWFSGSIVSNYSFDLLIAPLLIILAWRARPHSWHGAAALVALGLVAGFRQSALMMFALLAALAVAGSVRRVREALWALSAGTVALAVWFVPMVLAQPGGFHAWSLATRSESRGALEVTSILDHASGGPLNVGTFAAYTTVALLPLVALALLAVVGLTVRSLVRLAGRGRSEASAMATGQSPPATSNSADTMARDPRSSPARDQMPAGPRHRRRLRDWTRPWYQSRVAILVAATVPPMATVALIQFAKGGYLLSYLPGAVIALLLVPAALLRPGPGRADRRRSVGVLVWCLIASLCVAGTAVVGADRFLYSSAVLPVSSANAAQDGPWFVQTRYQAPYPDTRATIRSDDAIDVALARLGPLVDARRDVIVVDSVDGGVDFYRNVGWSLPTHRVALVVPGAVIYNEQGGSLFYTLSRTVPVAPGGSVYLIAPPWLSSVKSLAKAGKVTLITAAPHIGGFLVWKIAPGSSVLGVPITAVAGPRPLGSGLLG